LLCRRVEAFEGLPPGAMTPSVSGPVCAAAVSFAVEDFSAENGRISVHNQNWPRDHDALDNGEHLTHNSGAPTVRAWSISLAVACCSKARARFWLVHGAASTAPAPFRGADFFCRNEAKDHADTTNDALWAAAAVAYHGGKLGCDREFRRKTGHIRNRRAQMAAVSRTD